MSTRSLICVYNNGEYKVAQYSQYDGYPEGQGNDILSFLNGNLINQKEYGINQVVYNKDRFLHALDNCKFIEDEECLSLWKEAGEIYPNGSIPDKTYNNMNNFYPQLKRDMGSYVLSYIQKKGGVKLMNDLDFASDSLFCEWAYVIDYDINKFEVYKGFITEQHEGRFEYFQVSHRNKEYYPVKLCSSWDLDNLPTEKDFINYFLNREGI